MFFLVISRTLKNSFSKPKLISIHLILKKNCRKKFNKMLTKDYLFHFKTQLKLCNLFCCIPYFYDSESRKVKLLKTGISRQIYYLTIFSHVIYLFITCVNMYLNYTTWSLANYLKALVVIAIYALCAVCRLTFLWNEMEGLKLLNWFLIFEDHLLSREFGNKLIDFFLNFFIGTQINCWF